MSLLLGEPLQYAETHFKFRLPWSLLYRPWPEIIVDAPFQFVPNVSPKIWIVARDAHRFPVTINSIEIKIQHIGAIAEAKPKNIVLNINLKEQFEFHGVDIGPLRPGRYAIYCNITASKMRGGKKISRTFTRWNYPDIKPNPLSIHVLAENPPKPQGFASGEMHCHTHYSADHVEHGASPAVLQEAAKAVGLDFVNCTDHAYDFAFSAEDYTQEASSPLPRFESLKKETEASNRSGIPLMIASEEISVGNSKGENVHMTILNPEGYLPGLGDCGRNWLDNHPTYKVEKILEMTNAHCFAAHPFQLMGILEKFIFRRGYWKHEDFAFKSKHPIRGIQFWNGPRDDGFDLGREFWINELGQGNFLLPIGGNDAHGDLNDTTAVDLPLFSLKHTRDHVFGRVRTVVQISENKNFEEIDDPLAALHQAFAGDNCYITNGPALWWERHTDLSGRECITFFAKNTKDYGEGFKYIRIYGRKKLLNGKWSKNEEICMQSQVAAKAETKIKMDFEDYAYLRAECETATGHYALTSAAATLLR